MEKNEYLKNKFLQNNLKSWLRNIIFNKFIIYIVIVDLLLSAFYYFNLQGKYNEPELMLKGSVNDDDDEDEDEDNDEDTDDDEDEYIDEDEDQESQDDEDFLKAVLTSDLKANYKPNYEQAAYK